MSEQNNKSIETLTVEERIGFLKTIIATLPIDEKMKVSVWLNEACEKGGKELLGQKMVEMNESMNRMIAKASDIAVKAGTKIYDKTNETFEYKDTHSTGESNPVSDIFD